MVNTAFKYQTMCNLNLNCVNVYNLHYCEVLISNSKRNKEAIDLTMRRFRHFSENLYKTVTKFYTVYQSIERFVKFIL